MINEKIKQLIRTEIKNLIDKDFLKYATQYLQGSEFASYNKTLQEISKMDWSNSPKRILQEILYERVSQIAFAEFENTISQMLFDIFNEKLFIFKSDEKSFQDSIAQLKTKNNQLSQSISTIESRQTEHTQDNINAIENMRERIRAMEDLIANLRS